MKKLPCSELGGACDEMIEGDSFREMGENSKKHVMSLMEKGDTSHNEAMEKMKNMSEEDRNVWMTDTQKKFDNAEDTQ